MFDIFKRLLRDDSFFYGLLILLIGVVSFGLGKWSANDIAPHNGPASIILSDSIASTDASEEAVASSQSTTEVGQYVASKNGTKYHLPWCPGAKQMKAENKVWFNSKEEAEAAGYAPAANCKGI